MKQLQNYNTALYLRLSRDEKLQGESSSITSQRQLLTQYVKERGWSIVGEYIDDGYSSTNYDRPNFQRMIDDIEDGKINCVITKDLSRLGRNYVLTGQYTNFYFQSKGVRYIAVNDNVNTHEPLISQEVWNTVQKIRTSCKRVNKKKHDNIFEELPKCADCGRVLCLSSHYRKSTNDVSAKQTAPKRRHKESLGVKTDKNGT